MYEESEVINLFMSIVSIIVFWQSTKKDIERLRYFYLGFLCMVFAYFFTVIEGFIYKSFFNSLEHLSFALAGLAFAIASHEMLKNRGLKEQGFNELELIEQELIEQELIGQELNEAA